MLYLARAGLLIDYNAPLLFVDSDFCNARSGRKLMTAIWCCVQACLKALPHTEPGQRVNCIPGITALTDKRRLIETLVNVYGEGAFQIVPRTFLLPEQYVEWLAWLRAHAVCFGIPI